MTASFLGRFRLGICLLGAVAACGSRGIGADADEGTETGEGNLHLCEDQPEYAAVLIRLQAKDGAANTFEETTSLRLVVDYADCLTDHFLEDQKHLETCAPADALCTQDLFAEMLVECSLIGGQTVFDTADGKSIGRMILEYELQDDALEGLHVAVGPFPTEEVLGCLPLVSPQQVTGMDGDGVEIWTATEFSPLSAVVGVDERVDAFAE